MSRPRPATPITPAEARALLDSLLAAVDRLPPEDPRPALPGPLIRRAEGRHARRRRA